VREQKKEKREKELERKKMIETLFSERRGISVATKMYQILFRLKKLTSSKTRLFFVHRLSHPIPSHPMSYFHPLLLFHFFPMVGQSDAAL
jgi:hypothetical protein